MRDLHTIENKLKEFTKPQKIFFHNESKKDILVNSNYMTDKKCKAQWYLANTIGEPEDDSEENIPRTEHKGSKNGRSSSLSSALIPD